MAQLRFFVVLIIAAVFYVTLIDSAAVRSEEFAEKLQRFADAVDTSIAKLRIRRAIEAGGDKFTREICYSQPCGWAVYVPFSRDINSFISNTCSCQDKTYKCIRTDDDLSVSAYVYHCRQNTTSEDIEAPEDAN